MMLSMVKIGFRMEDMRRLSLNQVLIFIDEYSSLMGGNEGSETVEERPATQADIDAFLA